MNLYATLAFPILLVQQYAFMPRQPTHPHVLRTARLILGMSQKDLAARVGIATVTLQKFENGEASISRKLAWRISMTTDLNMDQLMNNRDPKHPRSGTFGIPLTKAIGLPRCVYTEADTENAIGRLVPVIRDLLNFAVKKKSFIWVSKSIRDSLEQIKVEFQGGAAAKQLPPKRGRPRKADKSARKPKPQPL
jgi:transcriptional regulator with XRE-family HTH domain